MKARKTEIVHRHSCVACHHTWDADRQEPTCRMCRSPHLNISVVTTEPHPIPGSGKDETEEIPKKPVRRSD